MRKLFKNQFYDGAKLGNISVESPAKVAGLAIDSWGKQ